MEEIMKVGFLGNIKDHILKEVQNMGYETVKITKEDLKSGIYDKDADILCGSLLFNLIDISDFKNLKYIFLFSQGIDYMPLDEIEKRGIILTNNKGAYAEPIGEFIVFGLLEMEKKAKLNILNQNEKAWAPRSETGNLYKKKILFLGTGDIAMEATKRLQGFDMTIVGYNTNGRDVLNFDYCVNEDGLEKEFEDCDYLVMVLPSTEKTIRFMNESRFSKLKDGVKFINVARGDVIDEDALIKFLQNGKIKAAVLDVFEKEPLPKESPLWEMDNVYITSHISGTSEDNEYRFLRNAVQNLKLLADGKDLINIVNFKKKY